MAKTIANFLVGVGLDTKDFDKGSRSVDTALGGFRSKAGIAGTAIAAAFSAAGVAAIRAGDKADRFSLSVAKFDTSRRFIYNLGNAFRVMGGDASEAVDAIAQAEGILDKLKKGDASALESAGLAQVNVSSLQNATDGEDLLRRLSIMMPDLEKWQQRSLQQTFGLSDAALATLALGSAKFDELISQSDKYAGNLEKAAAAGREYSQIISMLGIQFDEIGHILADKILPRFSGILKEFSKFIDDNGSKVNAVADYAAENAGGIGAIGGGLALSSIGAAVSAAAAKMGMGGLAKGAATGARLGRATTLAGAASLLFDVKPGDIEGVTGFKPNSYIWDKTPMDAARDVGAWWKRSTTPEAMAPPTQAEINAAQSPAFYPRRRTEDKQAPIVIDNRVNLNGREMARFVKEVNAEQRYEAVTDITSTVDR